ncbi:protein FAM24A-like [Acomys russatus]|uniref:protein FAM24A-like n=1 Tax=Acomys russatus TaxID=60746 RepID=UPI0021E28DB3|nr:protein FAM24A-like [Acomys russatus]
MYRPFDLRMIIMIVIGGGILAAMLILIGVVFCLYSKVAKALSSPRAAKEAHAAENSNDPCKVSHEKMISSKSIPDESCCALQCCDACSVYADVGSLPPCFCSVSEGL